MKKRFCLPRWKSTLPAILAMYFAAIVLVGTLINSLFYAKINQLIMDKAHSDISNYAQQIISFYDKSAKNAAVMGQLALKSREVFDYYMDDAQNPRERTLIIRAHMNLLRNMMAHNNHIDSVFVYYFDSKTVVSPNRVYDQDRFFQEAFVYDGLRPEHLLDKINDLGYLNFMPATQLSAESTSGVKETIFPVVAISSYSPKALLVMNLSADLLAREATRLVLDQACAYAIFDQHGNTFYQTGGADTTELVTQAIAGVGDFGTVQAGEGMGKYLYFHAESAETGWIYTTLLSAEQHFGRLAEYRAFSFGLAALLVSTGVLLFVLFSRRIVPPIRLLGSIDGTRFLNPTFSVKVHELTAIYNRLGQMFTENNQLKQRLFHIAQMEKDIALEKLLKGQAVDCEQTRRCLYQEQSRPEGPCYSVISLLYRDEGRQELYSQSQEQRYLALSAVISALEDSTHCFVVKIKTGEYSVTLNYGPETDIADISRRLLAAMETVTRANDGVSIKCGVSGLGGSLQDLGRLYGEALYALQACKAFARFDLVCCDSLHAHAPQRDYAGILKSVNIIGGCLSKGDWNELHQALREQVGAVYALLDADYDCLFTLFERLYNIERYVRLPQRYVDALSAEGLQAGSIDLHSVAHCQEQFCAILLSRYRAALLEAAAKPDDANDVARQIERMLNTRYGEDLYLEMIAREHGLSARHAARLFKQYCGESIHERLRHIRLEKAKALLEQTDVPIKEISAKVGFTSMASFGRFFKSMQGVSPSRYRQMVAEKTAQAQGLAAPFL